MGLRAGMVDQWDEVVNAESGKPIMEVYVERRPPWLKQVEGAEQRDARYRLVGGGEGSLERLGVLPKEDEEGK